MRQALILLFILFTCIQIASAQEKIYLKYQKDPIDCKVIEINTTEIKYSPNDAEDLIVGVAKNDVYKIVFKSGRVQYFTDPLQDFAYYKGQKRWIGKLDILSPAFGYTGLYLERSLKPGKSVEFQLNIIGLGKKLYYNNYYYGNNVDYFVDQKGASVGAGIKFLKMPDFETGNRKLIHILQGSYLKPTIGFGMYQRNFFYYDNSGQWPPSNDPIYTKRKNVFTGQLTFQTGKQWILDNTFCIDVYGLVGLGVDNFRENQSKPPSDVGGNLVSVIEENMPYSNFGYTRFGKGGAGLILGGGIKMGILFNTKKTKEISGIEATRKRLSQ